MLNGLFHRRSKRILLHVVVLIKARTPEGTSVEAQGFTRAVNAHGGLLDAPFRMLPGQHLTLVNPLSKREAGCRVVQVGAPSEGFFPTSFEFYSYDPQFWPVSTVPSDWGTNHHQHLGEGR